MDLLLLLYYLDAFIAPPVDIYIWRSLADFNLGFGNMYPRQLHRRPVHNVIFSLFKVILTRLVKITRKMMEA